MPIEQQIAEVEELIDNCESDAQMEELDYQLNDLYRIQESM